MSIWAVGLCLSMGLFFGDLLQTLRAIGAPKADAIESSQASTTRAVILMLPVELLLRFLIFLFLYYLGLRALDIEGMIEVGRSSLRLEGIGVFTRGGEYWLVSFFNNVSFVGELATMSIRYAWDAIFAASNILARYFVLFLGVNAVFLRLNVIATVEHSRAMEDAHRHSADLEAKRE